MTQRKPKTLEQKDSPSNGRSDAESDTRDTVAMFLFGHEINAYEKPDEWQGDCDHVGSGDIPGANALWFHWKRKICLGSCAQLYLWLQAADDQALGTSRTRDFQVQILWVYNGDFRLTIWAVRQCQHIRQLVCKIFPKSNLLRRLIPFGLVGVAS